MRAIDDDDLRRIAAMRGTLLEVAGRLRAEGEHCGAGAVCVLFAMAAEVVSGVAQGFANFLQDARGD